VIKGHTQAGNPSNEIHPPNSRRRIHDPLCHKDKKANVNPAQPVRKRKNTRRRSLATIRAHLETALVVVNPAEVLSDQPITVQVETNVSLVTLGPKLDN